MDVRILHEWLNELMLENERECNVNNVVHYRYSNRPVVVATIDVPKDERVPSYKIARFLESKGVKFDYFVYDREKCRYYAMLNKNSFERCQ